MMFRTIAAMIVAAFLGITILSGPALGAGVVQGRMVLAAADDTATYAGELAIKEGHGDILVRADNGDQIRLTVKDTTMITRNGKPATYDDLRSGDQLRIRYNAKSVVIKLDATGP
jgi:hypothetical protein